MEIVERQFNRLERMGLVPAAEIYLDCPTAVAKILVVLVLSNHALSLNELGVATAWPDKPSPSSQNSMAVHLSRLRKALEDKGSPARVINYSPRREVGFYELKGRLHVLNCLIAASEL